MSVVESKPRIPMMAVPDEVRVYDLGNDYHDRFTVIFPDDAIYGMSTNAMAFNGFVQYLGQNGEVPKDPKAIRVDEVPLHVFQKIMELMP